MADRSGDLADGILDNIYSSMSIAAQSATTTALTSGTREPVFYHMEARDSVTLAVFTWVTSFPDFTGTEYPGPNSPVGTAVRMTTDCDC